MIEPRLMIADLESQAATLAKHPTDDDGDFRLSRQERDNLETTLKAGAETIEALSLALFQAAQRLEALSGNAHAHLLTVQGTVAHMWSTEAHRAGMTQPCPPHPTQESIAVAYKQATTAKSNQDA